MANSQQRKFVTTRRSAIHSPSNRARTRLLTVVYPPESRSAHAIEEGLVIGRDPGSGGLVLDDSEASRVHAVLERVTSSDVIRIVDKGSSNGTFLDGAPIKSDFLTHGSVVRVGQTLMVYSELELPPGMPFTPPPPDNSLARMIAEHVADLVAPEPDPVLIVGPTGAGKELLARRIHEASGRSGELVAVNCATLNRELLGSEMFGHVKGAFSGAQRARRGLFSEADGGTLFLDEIAELPLDQQAAFLRVLQEGLIRPVGSDEELAVDVRVVAATHRNLVKMHGAGEFREDLYARLAGMVIDLPGLARRREEVLALFDLFAEKSVSLPAAEALLVYGWPRNVRELQKTARQIKIFGDAVDEVGLELLPEAMRVVSRPTASPETITRSQLTDLLAEHKGNIAEICRVLNKHRQQVYRLLRQHKLSPEDFRGG